LVAYENQCCDCATESYPCIGNNCSMRHVRVLICDECKDEVDRLYVNPITNEQVCLDCLLKDIETIK
jgi:hypothetical protein